MLGERLVAATGRDRWATFGGPGVMRVSAKTDALVVRQTRENHAAIVDVLTRWRTETRTGILVVEFPAAAGAAALLKAAGVAGPTPAVVTDAAAAKRALRVATETTGARLLAGPIMVTGAGRETSFRAGVAGGGVACRLRADADGDAVRLTFAAGFGGADAPAWPAIRVPAGGAAVYRHDAPGGAVRVALVTPAVVRK